MGPSSIKDRHKNKAEKLSHNDIKGKNGEDKLALDASFTKDNFKDVQKQFCLPLTTPWTILSIHSHFEQHMNTPDTIIGS
jgi:hypothetical protein